MGASLRILLCVKRTFGYIQNKGTSPGTLSQTPDLKISHRHIDRQTCYRQGGRSERDKLDRRRSAKLTIPPSSDSRPLVYHSNHQALSIARFRRTDLLATADTCFKI